MANICLELQNMEIYISSQKHVMERPYINLESKLQETRMETISLTPG